LLQELQKRYPEFASEPTSQQRLSFYDEIEEKRLPEVIGFLLEGKSVALVSDNGTPGISDPGFRLVREARKRNISVTPIPGPSAAIAALSVSGLPTNHFSFLGFLPEKQGARIKILTDAKKAGEYLPTTYILYCAPHKLEQTLNDILNVFGDIDVVLARELTKLFEEITQQKISVLLPQSNTLKGECVVLFSSKPSF
jgi:16S rRNA (cytidine1402-2'-O)-methyltransferase